jgi:hypothetical protein
MKTLNTAIRSRFDALDGGVHNGLYLQTSGQLYKDRAKQDAVLPYVVYHMITDVPEWTFDTDFERVRIQFDLYSDDESSSEIEDLYTALKALYEWQTLIVEGWTHVHMKRLLARGPFRDPGDDNWTYNVDFEILIEK